MKDIALILIIDDEEAMRMSCSQVLIKDGHRVETAENGRIGLEKINNLRPDLVLVDLKMPGIGGFEVLEKITEIDPAIIAVVITGYANLESAIQAFKSGAYDFLPKPFTPDELRIIINRGLEKRRLIMEARALEQEKEKMKKFFITMVSHQLRSPLATVQQHLENILAGIAGEVDEKQRKMLLTARNMTNDLLTLIKEWLNLSKMEAGKLAENFQSLSMPSLFEEIAASLQPYAEGKQVSIDLHLPDIPDVNGDRESLRQLFSSLIQNAVKFNKPLGEVKVSMQETPSHLKIIISDTGIGIPEKDLPFIFDEFYQAANSEESGESGTGLGLAIVKKIADAHSASIKVSSKAGEGTTFTILYPKKDE
jgi:signal transduction histidine kinase